MKHLLPDINETETEDLVHNSIEIVPEAQIENESLNYVGGFVASKFRSKYPSLGSADVDGTGEDWISYVKKKILYRSSDQFKKNLQKMEDLFKIFHGEKLTPGLATVSKMVNILKDANVDVPEEVMFFFFYLM